MENERRSEYTLTSRRKKSLWTFHINRKNAMSYAVAVLPTTKIPQSYASTAVMSYHKPRNFHVPNEIP